jgi:HAD superfamily hydrolase (TIGR01509 family)
VVKAVFFDIDGTLVDSNEFHVLAWHEAFREAGLCVSKEQIRRQIGKGADQLIPALCPLAAPTQQKDMADRHGEIFRSHYLPQVKPFPRATELIELLHDEGKEVVLASSADKAEVEHYVRLLGIAGLIKGMVSKDDVVSSKPAGDIFAAALAHVFPVQASETLAIGDTPYDVESASLSGVKTIALRSGGFSEEALAGAGAAYIYASVEKLFVDFDTTPLQS